MTWSQLAVRTAALAAVTIFSISDPCYAQRGGKGGGEGGGDGGGRSSPGAGGGGGSNRSGGGSGESGSAFSSRSSGGGQSSSRGSSQSAIRGSSQSGGSSQFRTSDGQSNQPSGRSIQSGSSSQARDGRSIQSGGSSQLRTTEGRANDGRSNDGRSKSVDGSSDQQQSFFRGPNSDGKRDLNREGDRDGRDGDRGARDGDRNVRDGDRTDRDRNDLNNFLSGRDGDRNRLDNDRDRNRDGDRDRNDWSRNANRLRNDWSRRDGNNLPFRYGWWNSYSNNNWPVYSPWRYSRWQNQPYYWWGNTPAIGLTSWYGWDRPRYWGYGQGANIYYQDNYVYYDGNRYLPANDYYQRMYDLAHSVPAIDQAEAEQIDWKPLGVFAVVPDGQDDSGGQRTMQLAISKQGVIAGTYYSDQNNEVHPLSGMVDQKSQRAAWTFADDQNPKTVFETSLFNLTKADSTMMVHFGPNANESQVWRLVRLERPEASGSGQAAVNANNLP